MEICIRDIQSYIPSRKLTNAELTQRLGVKGDFLEEKIGISNRCIAEDSEAVSDLGANAAEKLFEKKGNLKKSDVDLLVVVTQNPDYKLPHTAGIIQHKLQLGSVASFDINLGCSGFIYGLAVVKGLMMACHYKNAILVTADAYSKIIDPQDKNVVTLFGDAGAAVWLGQGKENKLHDFTLKTDGSGYPDLIVKGGGSKFPYKKDSDEHSANLHMDGRKIYNFMMKEVPKDVEECLKINHMSLESIDYFVFHQASKFMVESVAANLKIPKQKLVIYLRDFGNTVSSSIPIALEHLMKTKDLRGKNVLLSGFGVGLSWGSTIVSYS